MSASRPIRRGAPVAAGAALVAVALGRRAWRRRGRAQVELQRSITVQQPRAEVYRQWLDPQNQAVIWSHVAELVDGTEQAARWRANGPLGRSLEWETRVVEEREGELVRWHSTGDLAGEGSVELRDAPGDYGTEVTLRAAFDGVAARVLGDPAKLVLAKTLRRFKSLVESGEIPSTEHNPSGRES